MRLAVVGGTAAGPAAAVEAVRHGADVVLFEAGPHVSVGACEIPYHVAGQLGGASLIVRTPAQLGADGVDVRTRHRVTALDPGRGRLTVDALDFGSTHEERFDRLILATGARARRLGIPGEDAAGVFPLRTLADADALRAWLDAEDVRHVVVAGGGYVGVEMAEALRARGLRATILDGHGRVLAGALDPSLAAPMDAAVRAAGVTVRAERPVEILADGAGRVRAVRTDRRELIGCQAVVVAVGVEPVTELAAAAGIRLGATGGIATDDAMRTSHRAVWACGDVAEVPRAVDGRRILWPLAPVGRRTARVAARNAASRATAAPETVAPIAASAAVRVFGVEAATVGLSLAEAIAAGLDAVAETIWAGSRTHHFPGRRAVGVRLVAERGSGRLLGGQLVGAEGAALRANVLVPMIRAGATARALAEDTDLVYNPPLAPAVDPLRVAAREVQKLAEQGTTGARGRRRR